MIEKFPRAPRRLLVALLAALGAGGACACGFYPETPVYRLSVHPDLPLEQYAAGRLGVLRGSFARSYLAVAWRTLTGAPLAAEQQQAAKRLWLERLRVVPTAENAGPEWPKPWLEARRRVLGDAPEAIPVWRQRAGEMDSYPNCLGPAFASAAATLEARARQYGAGSPELREWIEAQDQVFANCGEGEAMPAAARADAPAQVKADRAYQRASALFYAEKYHEAAAAFDAIAQDGGSPWRELAPYLAARALIRADSLAGDATALGDARARLEKLIAVPGPAALRGAAQEMLDLVHMRAAESPTGAAHGLPAISQGLRATDTGPRFGKLLADYLMTLDKLTVAAGGEPVKRADEAPLFEKMAASRGQDEMTDWIYTFKLGSPAATAHAVERWRAGGALPWLLAALAKVGPGDAATPALLEAAARLPADSPGAAMAAYHRARLLAGAGRRDEARGVITQALARPDLPASARNGLLSLRMQVAAGLDEMLAAVARNPAQLTTGEEGAELPLDYEQAFGVKGEAGGYRPDAKLVAALEQPGLDFDALVALNRWLPLAQLADAATGNVLAEPLRDRLLLAVFVRAALLDDDAVATRVAAPLASRMPELAADLERYLGEKDAAARRFAAVMLMLRNPGARPAVEYGTGRRVARDRVDNFRDNWWCKPTLDAQAPEPGQWDRYDYTQRQDPWTLLAESEAPLLKPAFLEGPGAAARKELERLAALEDAPFFLLSRALEWAKTHAGDPRSPEALHLGLRVMRYGCGASSGTALAEQAFRLLHKRWPKSEWAAKTKVWY